MPDHAWRCKSCKTSNPPYAEVCRDCGNRPESAPPAQPDAQPHRNDRPPSDIDTGGSEIVGMSSTEERPAGTARPTPLFGVLSILCLPATILIAGEFASRLNLFRAILLTAAIYAAGSVGCAAISLWRKENHGWIALIGLILGFVPLAIVIQFSLLAMI